MSLGQIDPAEAIREGWTKDQDGEIGIDGYNAIITISTLDGSSGFKVQNSAEVTQFYVDSYGNVSASNSLKIPKIQITTGAQIGYVLKSDAIGNATWSSVSSSSITIKETEVDFGSIATRSKIFTIIDSDISITSHIIANQSFVAPTGKSQDENEMDALQCRCSAGLGQFTLYADSLFGPVRDKFKINYMVG